VCVCVHICIYICVCVYVAVLVKQFSFKSPLIFTWYCLFVYRLYGISIIHQTYELRPSAENMNVYDSLSWRNWGVYYNIIDVHEEYRYLVSLSQRKGLRPFKYLWSLHMHRLIRMLQITISVIYQRICKTTDSEPLESLYLHVFSITFYLFPCLQWLGGRLIIKITIFKIHMYEGVRG